MDVDMQEPSFFPIHALSPVIVHMVGDPHHRIYRGIDLATYVLTIGLPISLTQSPECRPLVEPTCARADPTATPQTSREPLLIAPSLTRVEVPLSITDGHGHVEMEDRQIISTLDVERTETHPGLQHPHSLQSSFTSQPVLTSIYRFTYYEGCSFLRGHRVSTSHQLYDITDLRCECSIETFHYGFDIHT